MTCDPMRWAMLFSTPGYHAVPLALGYPVYYPAISASYTAFCARLFRPLPPASALPPQKNASKPPNNAATLPLKSP